jgi:hypothetical protein
MTEPVLEKPGAGLPFHERLAARYFLMPYYSKRTSWDESVARFEKEGNKILARLKALSKEQRTRRVLVDRIQGIEDSSRYWSVAMTVEHLMIVGEAASEGMVLLSQGKVPPGEVRIENVKPKGSLDPMQLDDRYREFLVHYKRKLEEKIVDRNSKTKLYHPWLGPMNVGQWNWLMGSHQAIHRKQIDLILAN